MTDLIPRDAAIDTLTELSCDDNAHWGAIIDAIRAIPTIEPQPDPRDEVIARLVEALEVTRETAHSMAHNEFDGVWDQSDFDSYIPEADAALAAAKAVRACRATFIRCQWDEKSVAVESIDSVLTEIEKV